MDKNADKNIEQKDNLKEEETKEVETKENFSKEKRMDKIDKIFREMGEWVTLILIAFLIAISIKYFLGTFTTVKQLSMNPTLKQNDKLWLDRTIRTFGKEYQIGDIVTFEAPDSSSAEIVDNNNPKAIYAERKNFSEKFTKDFLELTKISFIKRVIAKEGDHVQIVGGYILVNGEIIKEEYLDSGTFTSSSNLTDFIVPENTLFLVGDNRKNSSDSRIFGCIPLDKMEGKIITRVLPLHAVGKIPNTYFEIEKINSKRK